MARAHLLWVTALLIALHNAPGAAADLAEGESDGGLDYGWSEYQVHRRYARAQSAMLSRSHGQGHSTWS